jgi:hypothetical protein
MKVTRMNISKPTKYVKNNEEKTRWDNVGTLTIFQKDDGSVSRLLEIPAIGLEARVFPIEEKKAETETPF